MTSLRTLTPSLALTLFACGGDATGSLVGGDPTTPVEPSSSSSSGGDMGDGGPSYMSQLSTDCQPGGGHAGNTWVDLYTCYFGPAPAAGSSCSVASGCHGTSSDFGSSYSGYTCGTDPTACYQSITSALVGSATTGPSSALYQVLRKATPTPMADCTAPAMNTMFMCDSMPQSPGTLTYESGDLARISAWIANGAQNDGM